MVHHMRAEAACRTLLDDQQHAVVARELLNQRFVERLDEARVSHRTGETAGRQFVGRAQAVG